MPSSLHDVHMARLGHSVMPHNVLNPSNWCLCRQHMPLSCRFTLAALENSDKAEAQRAQALVRRYGGRRFTSQTLHLLQGVDKGSIMALCPCSLPKHKITHLQTWGDFTSGAASNSFVETVRSCKQSDRQARFLLHHVQLSWHVYHSR